MHMTLKNSLELLDGATKNFKPVSVEAGVHEIERVDTPGGDWYVLKGTKVGALATFFHRLAKGGAVKIEGDPLFTQPGKENGR